MLKEILIAGFGGQGIMLMGQPPTDQVLEVAPSVDSGPNITTRIAQSIGEIEASGDMTSSAADDVDGQSIDDKKRVHWFHWQRRQILSNRNHYDKNENRYWPDIHRPGECPL